MKKNMKFRNVWPLALVALLAIVGCEKEPEPEPEPVLAIEVTFSIGETGINPAKLVISMSTPSTQNIQDAEVSFSQNEQGVYVSEAFIMDECGNYTVTGWTAYDEQNEAISNSAEEVTFSVCEASGEPLEHVHVELVGQEIPFNKFSYLGRLSDKFIALAGVEDGNIMALTQATDEFGMVTSKFVKFSTTGAVQYEAAFADDNDMTLSYSVMDALTNDVVVAGPMLATGANGAYAGHATYGTRIVDPVIRGVNPADGSTSFTVSQADLSAAIDGIADDFALMKFYGLASTPDGGFVLLLDEALARADHLVKFSSTGAAEWATADLDLGPTEFMRWGGQGSVCANNEGNILIVETAANPVFKLFSGTDGSLISERAEAYILIHTSTLVIEATSDGGFIITTANQDGSMLRLIKLNADATYAWHEDISNGGDAPYNNGRFSYARNGADGNIVLLAAYESADGTTYSKLYRFDNGGSLLSEATTALLGPGLDNLAQAGMTETNNTLEGKRGIAFAGEYSEEGAAEAQNWIGKAPSHFDFDETVNSPSALVYPSR